MAETTVFLPLAPQPSARQSSISRDTKSPAAAELKPLWRLLRDQLLASTKLFVDETTAPVLDPGRGRTKTGCFWVIARDDRPWGGSDTPAVVYSYAPGRGSEHAAALLKDFLGILQTDVRRLQESGGITPVFVKVVVRQVHAASLILRAPVSRSGFSRTSPAGGQLRGCPDHRSGLAARASAQRQARAASTV